MSNSEDLKDIGIKLGAALIIISAPLWPKRDLLSESGKLLYDAILSQAKEYALELAQENTEKALAIISKWPSQNFMEETLINHPDTMVRLANRRLLRVYKHYIQAAGVYWPAIK